MSAIPPPGHASAGTYYIRDWVQRQTRILPERVYPGWLLRIHEANVLFGWLRANPCVRFCDPRSVFGNPFNERLKGQNTRSLLIGL